MQNLEILLLAILLLFPIVDLCLEKYKFKNKSFEYLKITVMLWGVTGFLAFCFFNGVLSIEPPLYLPVEDFKSYLAIFMFFAFIAYITYVVSSLNRNEETRLYVVKALEESSKSQTDMLPESKKEFLLFTFLVSVSAGICEELIFRWYLYGLVAQQSNWIVAIISSNILFGLWHIYIGWQQVIKTAFVGVFLCFIYLYFESIVIAIIAHILLDVYAGTVSYYARKARAKS